MTSVRLDHITRQFGSTTAVADVSLSISAGELFFILGPSGCGKSTLLRMIAGLQTPTRGRIFFNDKDVTSLDTRRRNAVMCFQSYALWPHMTAAENIRFGLDVRHRDAASQKRRVAEMLDLVRLHDLGHRKPNELSGGQQQRLALARALAVEPACLLLDEPLSNLDAKMRLGMRSEIRRICKASGSTTIYVTHDQKEALSIADRIAVMNAGRLAQVGTPGELYYQPQSAFVADFLGQTNLIEGQIISQNGNQVQVQTKFGPIIATAASASLASPVMVSIRPEQIRITSSGRAANRVSGRVVQTTFLGDASEHLLAVDGAQLKIIRTPPVFDAPSALSVEFDASDALALPG